MAPLSSATSREVRLNLLHPLDRADGIGRDEIGGKAVGIARLEAAGLPVPPAFAVPASVFRRAAMDAGIALDGDPAGVAAALRSLALPEAWARAWTRAAAALGPVVAVRSSAVDEDGAEHSFAGMHRTELGVRPADVPAAILRVWASLFEAPAVAYRGRADGAMAVVVQRQIDPRVSGVLFTINPLNGSWREMVVESCWGLGEGLVSGQIAPHWHLVRRPHRLPGALQRLWSRVRLDVMQEDLPELPDRYALGGNGQVLREAVPAEDRHARTLSRRQLLRLCRLGLRIEHGFGAPQDVEWCIDGAGRTWVLQARPITRTGSPRSRADVVWTRRFIGERWPEPATPMGWSILEPVFAWFIAYPRVQERYLGGGPAVKLVGGWPYLNATIFRHLAFKLPGSPPPRFMGELLPPEEERAWRQRRAVPPDLGVYGAVLRDTWNERRWRRFRFNPFTNPDVWDAWQAELVRQLPKWESDPDSTEAALRRVEEQIGWIVGYSGIHLCSLLFANLLYQLLEAALAAWLPERRAALMEALATCPPGNRTLEGNAALWRIGQMATEADLERLRDGGLPDPDSGIGQALAAFLEEYGHRSEASWEICAPRWRQDPSRLIPLLRAQRSVGSADPSARIDAQEQAFAAALDELRRTLPPGRREVAGLLVAYVRRYLLLRENQRFWFDHLLFATQRALLAAGDGLVARGLLERAEDVALLTWPELQGVVAGTLDADAVPEWVARRRAERAEQRGAPEPPVFLVGDDAVAPPPAGRRLDGLGISPGRARGRVRIVRSPREGHKLQPGEVLVARAVDPGWTPLLAVAGAVVLEMGGMLSHGAVVAREYRVPMVVNVQGGIGRLVDGVEVTVDGTRGAVWIHP